MNRKCSSYVFKSKNFNNCFNKEFDFKSLIFLTHLRLNARKKFSVLAKNELVSVSTVNYHFSFLKKSIIKKFVSMIDFPSLGFYFRTFVFCDLFSKSDLVLLSYFVSKHNNINNLYFTSSGFIADFVFSDFSSELIMIDFFQKLKTKSFSHFRIEEMICEEIWLPAPILT